MRRALFAGVALLVLIVAVVLIRTFNFTPEAPSTVELVTHEPDPDVLAQHMSEAIRFKTVSKQRPSSSDPEPFEQFIAWFETTYPEVHAAMTRELLGHTILLRWPGADPNAQPILLTSHYDVVPVIPGTESLWKEPPYSGNIVDGYVWGRGALDDKSGVIAIAEAATLLLKKGFTPKQTVYLSFGHDEEVSGREGAGAVAKLLKEQGVQLAWSLDEGSFVLDGLIPGLEKPVASINVAEKGYTTLQLIAKATGGHSSVPPGRTAVGDLAEAIVKLQNSPLPGGLEGVSEEMYDALARHMSFAQRMAFANRWLFGGLVESTISRIPAGNASLRTTIAPTMLSGSIKENVLPIRAVATVNFRLHPRDTVESLMEHVREAIENDAIEINLVSGNEASNVADTSSPSFAAMKQTVVEVFGDVIVAPGLTVAATDSRHYALVADNAYRFHPVVVGPEDMATFHGTNERISIENLVRATNFYAQLLLNVNE